MYKIALNSNNLHSILSVVVVAGMLYVFLFGSALVPTAHADSMPGGDVTDPAVRATDLAKPAVVRIITTITGHLTVHFPPTTDVAFPQNNNGNYPLQLSGTGTFISANGDILTADHVVSPPQDQALNTDLYTTAAQDVANYINKNPQQSSTQVTKDQVVQELSSGQLKSTAQYDKPSSAVYLSTDYIGNTQTTDFKNLPAGTITQVDQIKKESPPNQQDIAIIHIPRTDTLSVQLGDSSNVQQQDKLTIVGFPGNADVSKAPSDLLTSSVNQIYVSSMKTSDNGAPLIQVGGNVEQGDSGGPALDSQGNIVGIVSFGAFNPSGPNGTSFLQASNSARSIIKSLNLDTTPGNQQKLWSQAFSDYAATTKGHWGKAQQGFDQLLTSDPGFKAATVYRNYTQPRAQAEGRTGTNQPVQAVPTPAIKKGNGTAAPTTSFQSIALTVGAALVFVILIALLMVSALRRRNKQKKGRNLTTPPAGLPVRLSRPLGDKKAPGQNISTPQTIGGAPTAQGGPATPNMTQSTFTLRAWPCGHMNRPNARFCSICGEPAPTPPTAPRRA